MVSPQHAVAVYAESFVSERRVLVVGDASHGLGERMAELGARAVEVWDPSEDPADEETRIASAVVVRALPLADEDVRTGAFDVAFVSELAAFEDPKAIVTLARRAVGDRGIAFFCATNREAVEPDTAAFDYYELFDAVAAEFEDVRMIAQLPFRGIALAQLGQDEDATSVNVDTQLADTGRVPDAFIAVASAIVRQAGAYLDPYSIVELPSEPDDQDAAAEFESDAAFAVEEAQQQIQAQVSQLEQLRGELAGLEQASAGAMEVLESQLHERTTRVAELERALALGARQLEELSAELEATHETAAAEREAGNAAAAQVEQLQLRVERAERSAAGLGPELSRLSEAHTLELSRLEEALRERGQAVRGLEDELVRRERIIRELVDTLEESEERAGGACVAANAQAADKGEGPAAIAVAEPADRAAMPPPDRAEGTLDEENERLRSRLDGLALELARREGEAQANAWAVAELERRLEQASQRTAGAPSPDLAAPAGTSLHEEPEGKTARELRTALDELDALRQALAQEHSARQRAESGEELARAKAELARQASLLKQLGHDPYESPETGRTMETAAPTESPSVPGT
jgi:hypothetical protein